SPSSTRTFPAGTTAPTAPARRGTGGWWTIEGAAPMNVRPYRESDRAEYAAIRSAIDPERPVSLGEAAHQDAGWDSRRYYLARFVAEEPDGRISGWGQVAHLPWQFHPRKYG